MRKIFIISIYLLILSKTSAYSKNDFYEKIDLFGEVIENIKKDYVDDIDQDNMDKWGIPGTPAYFLIQPDGIVAWNSEDNSKTLAGAIEELTPKEGA